MVCERFFPEQQNIFNQNIIENKDSSINSFNCFSNFKKLVMTKTMCMEKNSQFDNNYEILNLLGKGKFGSVYKCRNKFDKLIYAIKILEKKSQGKNEAQALASLNILYDSKHIVRYFSSWEENNKVYIAMECCSQNLQDLIQSETEITEITIRRMLKNICNALHKIHKENIVHLDIKPENILLSNNNQYKLSDLGLAKALYHKNDVNTLQEGDSRYMAGELLKDYSYSEIKNNKKIDLTKADIFSLGLTVYKLMLRNRITLPRNGVGWKKLRNNCIAHLDKLSQFSNSLKRLVLEMLNADPCIRPSAEEIISRISVDFENQKIEELNQEILRLKSELSFLKNQQFSK